MFFVIFDKSVKYAHIWINLQEALFLGLTKIRGMAQICGSARLAENQSGMHAFYAAFSEDLAKISFLSGMAAIEIAPVSNAFGRVYSCGIDV